MKAPQADELVRRAEVCVLKAKSSGQHVIQPLPGRAAVTVTASGNITVDGVVMSFENAVERIAAMFRKGEL